MAGGLDNLSAEGFSQLSKTINEAKELIKQQEALLRQTLQMEQQIITRRTAGLKEQASLSAEMYKINEAGKEAANHAEKAAKSAKQAQNSSGSSSGGGRGGSRSAGQTSSSEDINQLDDADSANWEAIGKKRKDILVSIEELQVTMDAREKERAKVRAELEKDAYEATLNAMMAKEQASGKSAEAETARANAVTEARIRGINKVAEAERGYYELINKITAEQEYLNTNDGAKQQADYINALENEKALQALQADWDKQRQELIYQEQLKAGGKLDAAAMARVNAEMAVRKGSAEDIEKRVAEVRKQRIEEEEKKRKKEEEDERKRKAKADADERKKKKADEKAAAAAQSANVNSLIGKGHTFAERKEAWDELTKIKDPDTGEYGKTDPVKVAGAIASALGNAIKQLENQIDKIGENKGLIDTRLQGSSSKTSSGSYWDQIVKDMASVGAVSPYFKQEDFANKIKELVDTGIAFDLEQRAFLATISNKIATTFNVADSTLLRLIRIQQQDSTAGRLGMESALNSFLNEMYENTEYLKNVAASVRSSLEEMQALMEGAAATEVEYQVQKWMGSLYSVGMSQDAVNKISSALGQIAAGQIEGLTGDGAGNLLIMAANNAGVPIADILAKGLNADETNELLQATVNYLAELAESSKDNQVVQQQLANVFGVKASDLRAATNLATKDSVGAIYDNNMTYDNMLYKLYKMAGSLDKRTSTGEMLSNLWSNITYSLAGGIASSPMAYGTFKAATLLDDVAGGLEFSLPLVMGTGTAQTFKIADILRVASLSGGIISSMGELVSGLGNSFSGQKMLEQLGIRSGSGLTVTPRGDGGLLTNGGASTISSSGYVGNASNSDVKNSTIQQTKNETKQQVIEAVEESEANQITTINTTVLKIYELLDDVAHGNSYFRVKVEGYGLTKAGSSSSSLGGVSALDALSNSSNGSYSTSISGSSSGGSSLAAGGVNSGSASNSINFGGWTTTV